MPTYEYKCDNGHTFEVTRRFDDEAVESCEVCGAPIHRVFHPIAIHFKGSGFHNTDYGTRKRAREMAEKKNAESSSSSSSDSKSSSSSDSSSSSESKSDSKSDSKSSGKSESKAAASKD